MKRHWVVPEASRRICPVSFSDEARQYLSEICKAPNFIKVMNFVLIDAWSRL